MRLTRTLRGRFRLTETAPDAEEHEGSNPSFRYRLYGAGAGSVILIEYTLPPMNSIEIGNGA